MAVLQFKKSVASDEGRQRQAALLAFSAFSELKHIFLVDEDVDCFDMNDVLWAMNTRFQGDLDTITIPGVRCHPLTRPMTRHFHRASGTMALLVRLFLTARSHLTRRTALYGPGSWNWTRPNG